MVRGVGGRPTLYKPEMCALAAKLRKGLMTDEEIAKELGINVRTFYKYKATIPEFAHAVYSDDDILNKTVEKSLYHRAVGMSLPALKITHHVASFNGELSEPVVVKTKYRQHIPPDPGAAMHWLKTRDPKRWGDSKPETDAETIAKEEASVAALLGLVAGGNKNER